jgi:hypothetical protein
VKTFVLVAIVLLTSSVVRADDDSDIVTGCVASNAEFGAEMAQVCINANRAARDKVQQYPVELKSIVALCSRRKEMGWDLVQKCIEDDIAAGPVLESYAREHPAMYEYCQNEFRGREAARLKLCVDMALEVEKSLKNK